MSVMYPNTRGARFNHEYYRDKHMPLVKARMAERCRYYTVDKGLAGATPDARAAPPRTHRTKNETSRFQSVGVAATPETPAFGSFMTRCASATQLSQI